MSLPTMNIADPGRILLATDLSARCDRALDRAARLATEWQIPLLIVHAMPRDGEYNYTRIKVNQHHANYDDYLDMRLKGPLLYVKFRF